MTDTLEEEYEKLKQNYNGLNKKHVAAKYELKRFQGIEEEYKRLTNDLRKANKKIADLRQSKKHLRERLL